MEKMRVLIANEPRTYREVLVDALRELRPQVEVNTVESYGLVAEIERLRPHLVVCSWFSVVMPAGPLSWVVLYPHEENQAEEATVSSGTADPDEGNNVAAATTQVNAAADLAIDKSDSPDPVGVGQELTYTLTISNDGPSAATGVIVTDDLPNSVIYDPTTSSPECALRPNREHRSEVRPGEPRGWRSDEDVHDQGHSAGWGRAPR